MILRARVVVTMEGAPIENGAVTIAGDRIASIGTFDEIKAQNTGDMVDLGERVLLPGLINAHCHLDYTCLHGKIPRQKSFTDWIRAINAEKTKLSPEDYVASIDSGFGEAKRFGTTTIANLTAFPELISRVAQSASRTWWFAELIDVRSKVDVDLVVEELESAEHWGLAPHAPFTASAELYRTCAEFAPIMTTHLAESREEMEMFRDARGELYEFLKEIGRDMSDCGGTTPVERFLGRLGDASLPWIVTHLNELAESDFDLMAGSADRFSVVHCPRSHAYFGHSRFQFERLQQMGFNVCLGTDSLASNEDLSLFAEMRAFQLIYPDAGPEEILAMATVNPARALEKSHELGRIGSGFGADLIAVPFAGSAKAVFDEIVAFRGEPWTMIAGEPPED